MNKIKWCKNTVYLFPRSIASGFFSLCAKLRNLEYIQAVPLAPIFMIYDGITDLRLSYNKYIYRKQYGWTFKRQRNT